MRKNRILTLVICLILSMQSVLASVAYADDIDTDLSEEIDEELNKALYDEQMSEFEAQDNEVIGSTSEDYWIQYEGDREGMSDSEIVYRNWYEYYLKEVRTTMNYMDRARTAINSQTEDGLFSGVDYTLGNFARHFGNCSCLYVAYAVDDSPENELYGDERIPGIIEKAMEGLLAHTGINSDMENLMSTKWWQITIGTALNMQPTIVLCRDILPDDLVERLCDKYFFGPDEVPTYCLEGTNTIWYATQMVIKGSILGKPELIANNIDTLCSIIVKQDFTGAQKYFTGYFPQGVMPDGSFHQHGPLYYTQYMQNSLNDFTKNAMITLGTEFEPIKYYDDFLFLLTNGGVDIYRGTEDDFLRNGRVLAQSSGISSKAGGATYNALKIMQKILPERADELEQYVTRLLPADDPNRTNAHFTKHYYNSDYMVNHREDYFASVSINTKRTFAIEFDPAQGRNSWNMNMGQINIVRDNDTVTGTFPCWDWNMQPGVTCAYNHYVPNQTFRVQNETFGGGVTNGDFGMMAMKLTDDRGVSAKKAYFFFDDEIMLLGSDINAINKDEINTGVDRRRVNGDVFVNGEALESKGIHSIENVSTVFHNNMGYIFPDTEDIVVTNNTRTGDWAEYWYAGNSKKRVTETMFELRMCHGKNPVNDTYNCIILPMTTQEELYDYAQNNPIEVVSNTNKLQAVYHNELNVGFAVFYNRGEVKFNDNLSVEVDSPTLIMVTEKDGELEVCASDPYAQQTTMNAKIRYNGKTYNAEYKFLFHDENLYNRGGRTEIKTFK